MNREPFRIDKLIEAAATARFPAAIWRNGRPRSGSARR